MKHSIQSQQGAFAIELMIVLLIFAGIYLFMTDISHKLLVRAQLDRTSFALVNILKERTRFYGGVSSLSDSDQTDMRQLAYRMLDKDETNLAIKIEALHNKSTVDVFTSAPFEAMGCQAVDISEKGALAPIEDGTIYSLYQVSLCDQKESWFANFWGDSGTPTFTITSSSVVAGR
ncbi:membrane associated secretion system protein [Vibrio sp. 10N.286.49.C2]|uniref:tight adherence pilus pseudopilin TadF n=1 Tax=unclassified Vibrio TaxID=2614977 RepID=UPI000C846357|nr:MULTISPECIES: tight adherence pilus pseudopilin TadF [unclassified Vibrio]PMH37223.1 membrane associated secretion system protein [Vibrio sp. 10N.286.49.C2]PMH57368.1 membrane associated secretion system protein [Vibrio sp. 10N.286.49.B1]